MAAVLFDVDGTLVDSTYVHVVTWGQALAEAGMPTPSARIHRGIGMGAPDLLPWLLGATRAAAVQEEATARHGELFLRAADGLTALPGARELVAHCVERGLRVVLATSANPPERDALLRALALTVEVTGVTDAGDAETAKPDPEILQVALARAATAPGDAVMVGDARWDIEAARRAGMPGVGVESGGLHRSELLAAGAVAVYDGPAELLAAFDSSPLGVLAA